MAPCRTGSQRIEPGGGRRTYSGVWLAGQATGIHFQEGPKRRLCRASTAFFRLSTVSKAR